MGRILCYDDRYWNSTRAPGLYEVGWYSPYRNELKRVGQQFCSCKGGFPAYLPERPLQNQDPSVYKIICTVLVLNDINKHMPTNKVCNHESETVEQFQVDWTDQNPCWRGPEGWLLPYVITSCGTSIFDAKCTWWRLWFYRKASVMHNCNLWCTWNIQHVFILLVRKIPAGHYILSTVKKEIDIWTNIWYLSNTYQTTTNWIQW